MKLLLLLLWGIAHAVTTSVVIPCCGKHFSLLKPLLESYAEQTCLPDEIVISLSDAERLSARQLASIEGCAWPFSLKLLKHAGRRSAGQNRNSACAAASGEVFLLQDADDLPHPQRVEIVKFLFETHEIDHLCHLYSTKKLWLIYSKEQLKIASPHRKIAYVHNGNVCIRAEVAHKVAWEIRDGGEDERFNEEVVRCGFRSIILLAPLVLYRNDLSSFQ